GNRGDERDTQTRERQGRKKERGRGKDDLTFFVYLRGALLSHALSLHCHCDFRSLRHRHLVERTLPRPLLGLSLNLSLLSLLSKSLSFLFLFFFFILLFFSIFYLNLSLSVFPYSPSLTLFSSFTFLPSPSLLPPYSLSLLLPSSTPPSLPLS